MESNQSNQPTQMRQTNLKEILENFVKDTCAGRNPTHGFEHAEKVAKESVKLFDVVAKRFEANQNENNIAFWRNLTMVCAYLHDVPDSKFDLDGKLMERCKDFLAKEIGYDAKTAKLAFDIINTISYSKEAELMMKMRKNKDPHGYIYDWTVLLGESGLIVRNIISDVDKIESIGRKGIVRIVFYTRYTNPTVSREELKKEIKRLVDTKLCKLYPENFIKYATDTAKAYHEEMLRIMEDLDSFLKDFE